MKKMKLMFAGAVLSLGLLSMAAGVLAEEENKETTFSIEETVVVNKSDLAVTEGTIEVVKDNEEETFNVILKDEEGKEYIFEKVDVEEWKDLSFVKDYDMYYIQYTDKAGKAREAEEKTEEIIWDTPITMYAMGSVNVRTAPVNGAEAIYYASLGEQFQVLGIAPGWFKIQVKEGVTGYLYHKYLTEDKAVIDALEEAQRLAAEAEYEENYNYSAPAPKQSSSNKKPKKECLEDGILN